MQLVFDLETNGLLPEVSTLHVCCTYDLDTKEEWYSTDPQEILDHLDKATHLICHNQLDFDLQVLKKLFNWSPSNDTKLTDTLVLSRLSYPDRQLPPGIPDGTKPKPHSLGAWGYRVGIGKPDHEDWTRYSEAMLHRCREDVRINVRVYELLQQECKDFGESVPLEHEVQRIMSKQERDGVYFDTERARGYVGELTRRVESIDERLTRLLPQHCRQVGVTVRKPFKKDGSLSKMSIDWRLQYWADVPITDEGMITIRNLPKIAGPFTRIEWYTTDLNSDKQVKEWLLSIGWKPTKWNISKKTGLRTSPKLEEDSFDSLPPNVGSLIKERVCWRHRRSQIQGWINRVREDHCLPAGANPCGTNTGRMRQRCVVNVPKNKDYVPFGKEMRSLFQARPGRVIVGHDADQIELRMLAHYMKDPEYIENILHDDIHCYNQRLAGLSTRDLAKTFIYALNYGGGNAKLGSIIGGSANAGAKLRSKFLSSLPAFGKLVDSVKKASRRGYLIGLDGRKIYMRKDTKGKIMVHKALNTLLQCAAAVVMKKSLILLEQSAKEAGLDYIKVIDMHDEGQADVLPEHAELYGQLAVQSIIDAGKHFNLNIPLGADYKIGQSWAETH